MNEHLIVKHGFFVSWFGRFDRFDRSSFLTCGSGFAFAFCTLHLLYVVVVWYGLVHVCVCACDGTWDLGFGTWEVGDESGEGEGDELS